MKSFKVFLLLLLVPWLLQAQTLKTSVFSSGGGAVQSAGYNHFGTFGQPLSVGTVSTSYLNREGFIFAQQNCVNLAVSSGQVICYNTAPDDLTSTITFAEGTITYQWQLWSGSEWQDIDGANSGTYAPGVMTQHASYRLVINDKAGCGEVVSQEISITVLDEYLAEAYGDQIICYNNVPEPLTSSVSGGSEMYDYQWQILAGTWTNIPDANAEEYQPEALTQSTSYRLLVTDPKCGLKETNTVTVTVYDEFTTGTIEDSGENICYGGDPDEIGSIEASGGGDGDISYQWQSSIISGSEGFGNILQDANGETYDPPSGIEVTTWYRRLAKDGTCNADFTASQGIWKVYTEPLPVTGILVKNPDATGVCFGEEVSAILLPGTGGNGADVLRYQTQTSGSEWSEWQTYNSGVPIQTDGFSAVRIQTWRSADFCNDAEPETVQWSISPLIDMPLQQGWSAISSYLDPVDPKIVNMLSPVASQVTILMGTQGIYAPPPFNINTLVNWDVLQGYKIKMKNPAGITFCGNPPENNDLIAGSGYHIIPVLSNVISPISVIFDNPATDVLYILDLVSNHLYWPAGGIFSLSELTPGKGYLAHFINPVIIDFPDYNQELLYELKLSGESYPTGPWQCTPNFNVHLIAIDNQAIETLDADFIGAFDDEGTCIGFAETGKTSGNTLLTIYGDDEYTIEKDGAAEGEVILFKAWNNSTQSETSLTATFDPTFPQHTGTYQLNGQSKITAFLKATENENNVNLAEQVLVYPNPAREVVTVVYPFDGTTVDLTLTTIEGKVITKIKLNRKETEIDIRTLEPGVYILRFECLGMMTIKRLVIN